MTLSIFLCCLVLSSRPVLPSFVQQDMLRGVSSVLQEGYISEIDDKLLMNRSAQNFRAVSLECPEQHRRRRPVSCHVYGRREEDGTQRAATRKEADKVPVWTKGDKEIDKHNLTEMTYPNQSGPYCKAVRTSCSISDVIYLHVHGRDARRHLYCSRDYQFVMQIPRERHLQHRQNTFTVEDHGQQPP